MADEMSLGGTNYISSKRASELSGYTQDYIGQLARASLIDARRIGGLWYVLLESLTAYKASAESYKPAIPEHVSGSAPDTVVNFDGTDYISAARAGKITGYHQDYVGQLARGGKVESRRIGNRWFVSRAAVESHKRQKDALLGVVQAEAVGIRGQKRPEELRDSGTFFSYTTESHDPIPGISAEQEAFESFQDEDNVAQSTSDRNHIPIRVADAHARSSEMRLWSEKEQRGEGKKSSFYKLIMLSAFTVVIVLSVGFVSLKSRSVYAFETQDVAQLKTELASSGTLNASLARIAEILEKLLGHQESYVRAS